MIFRTVGKIYDAIGKFDYNNSLFKIENMEKEIHIYSDKELIEKLKKMPISVSYEVYTTPKLYHPRIVKCIKSVYIRQLAQDLWRSNWNTSQVIVNNFKHHPKDILKKAATFYDNNSEYQHISYSENVKKGLDYLLNK